MLCLIVKEEGALLGDSYRIVGAPSAAHVRPVLECLFGSFDLHEVVELPDSAYLSQMKQLAYEDLVRLMRDWNQLQVERMHLDEQITAVTNAQKALIRQLGIR